MKRKDMISLRLNQKTMPSWYKWVIAVLSGLIIFVGLGWNSGTRSLYTRTITVLRDIDRASYSLSTSIRFGTTAILSLFFGAMIGKMGAKKMVLCGITSLFVSCVINSVATELWMFYVAAVFLGTGLAWCTTSLVGFVINRWFTEKRGTVTGVVLASNSLGAAIGTQVLSPLIYKQENLVAAVERTREAGITVSNIRPQETLFKFLGTDFGYQDAYTLVAGVLVVIFIIVALFYKEAPAGHKETGEKPAKGKKKPSRAAAWVGMSFSEAIRKPYFYLIVLCVYLTGASLQAANGIAAPHMEDCEITGEMVAWAVSAHSLVLSCAKILGGVSFDKFGLRKTLLVMHTIGTVSLLLLAFVTRAEHYGLAMAYETMVSLAMPLETIMLPLITADLFGDKDYAKMMGIMVAVNTFGHATGEPIANLVYEFTGRYNGILFVFAGIMAVVLICFQLVMNKSNADRKEIIARHEAALASAE